MQVYRVLKFFGWLVFMTSSLTALAGSSVTTSTSGLADAPFSRVQDCFSGRFASYDQFIRQISERNADKPFYVRWTLPLRFDSDTFAQYQQQLHCKSFVYPVDGVLVRGYYVAPKQPAGLQPKRLPVVLYNRGGNGGFGSLNFVAALQHLMPLAAQGYVVLASNYRGAHNWSKVDQVQLAGQIGQDEFGGADVADVVALAALARQLPDADAERLLLYGVSRGGMMALLAARKLPQTKAIVLVSAVTDLPANLQQRPEMARVFSARIPDYASNQTAALQQRSARYWPQLIPASLPILQLHGSQDDRVAVQQAQDFAKAMQQHPHYQLHIYPDGDHFLQTDHEQLQADIRQFLQAKAPALLPTMAPALAKSQ